MEYNTAPDVYICEWKIPEFLKLINQDLECKSMAIQSHNFVPKCDIPPKWYFILYYQLLKESKSSQDNTEDHNCMTFCIGNPCYSIYSRNFLYILNANGEKIPVNTLNVSEKYKMDKWKRYTFSNKTLLDNPKMFLPNDSLSIVCIVYVDKYLPSKPSRLFIDTELNDEFGDVTIVADNKEFRVHKSLLCDHSSVFTAMFSYETKEKKENRIDITDINSEILKAMLQYIYTNQVNNINDIMIDLLRVADKYDMIGLENLCVESLLQHLTLENIKEISDIGQYYNVKQLTKYIRHFLDQLSTPLQCKEVGCSYECD